MMTSISIAVGIDAEDVREVLGEDLTDNEVAGILADAARSSFLYDMFRDTVREFIGAYHEDADFEGQVEVDHE